MNVRTIAFSLLALSLGFGFANLPEAVAQDAAQQQQGTQDQSGSPFKTMDQMLDALEEKPEDAQKGGKKKGDMRKAREAKVAVQILFKYDSTDIMPASMAQVEEMGKALSNDRLKNYKFEIAGHTDTSGSAEYNKQLSNRRAEAVKDYLVKTYNIEADRLVAVGYGEEKPVIAPDDTDAKRLQNRRVEIVRLERYNPATAK